MSAFSEVAHSYGSRMLSRDDEKQCSIVPNVALGSDAGNVIFSFETAFDFILVYLEDGRLSSVDAMIANLAAASA